MKHAFLLLGNVVLALGLAASGFFIGNGLRDIKKTDRYVSVRGLAERDVQADTANLTISFRREGNDPAAIFPVMDQTQKQVVDFLKQKGIDEKEMQIGQWSTVCAAAEDLKDDPTLPRYTVTGNVAVSTHNIAALQTVNAQINDLRVKTSGGVDDSTVVYSFEGIAALRADMIAAATKDARNAALQFAADSNSKVGSIHNASQGIFQITAPGQDTDNPLSIAKAVRVVTTVDYELRD